MIHRLIFLIETVAHLLCWAARGKGSGNPILAIRKSHIWVRHS